MTPEWSLPFVVSVSLETVILVAWGLDEFLLQLGNMVLCCSRQLENRRGNYPTHVNCVDHSGGCDQDQVECRSRKQFLEADSTRFANQLAHSGSTKSPVMSQYASFLSSHGLEEVFQEMRDTGDTISLIC